MTINVAGHQMEVGESLTNFIKTELKAVLEKLLDNNYEANVHLSKNNHEFIVDLSVNVNKNFTIHCKSKDIDAYKSVNEAIEKFSKRIRKYKDRLKSIEKNKINKVDDFFASYSVVNHEAEDSGEDTPVIIAEMEHKIETLSVSEAVMKLDLTDSNVIVFNNSASDKLNVVYRRKDSNIGWINPK